MRLSSHNRQAGPIRRRARSVSVLLLVGSLIVAGCGGAEEAGDVEAREPAPAEPAPPEAPEAAPEPEPEEPGQPAGNPELLWSVDYEGRFDGAAMHPNGELVAIAEDATYLHQLADGLLVDAVVYTEVGPGTPDQIVYGADGNLLFAGLHVSNSVVTGQNGEVLLTLPGGNENRIAVSDDVTLLATAQRSGTIVLYDITYDVEGGTIEADQRAEIPTPDDLADAGPTGAGVTSLQFTAGAERLIVVHRDQVARVWDVANQELMATIALDGEGAHQSLIAISADGGRVAGSVRVDGAHQIHIWDASSLVDAAPAPTIAFEVLERVRDLAWSPDGSLLAVASRLGTTIWDAAAGSLVYTFDEEFDATASQQPLIVEFTPDGGHVLIARGDRTLELWRLPGAEPLEVPERIVCEPIPVPGDVLFDTGSDELRSDADDVLEELAEELAATYQEVTFTFVGHTDSRGDAAANERLSLARAETVRDWFAQWATDSGITGWSLEVDGRGESELKVVDVDANGQFLPGAGQLNRRVEIEIDAEGCA